MNKLKQWLRRWLGVEEDKREFMEFIKAGRYNDELNERWCERLDKRLSNAEDIIGKTIRAGFDHHVMRPSWIVLAWRDDKGREHVHFYEVGREIISQINAMLKSLKRENVIVDTHPQIFPQFKW